MDEIQLERKIGGAIKWLEALVSGEYKQGKRKLGNAKIGYCCWGLACHIVKMRFNSNDGWQNELMYKIGFKTNGHLQKPVKGVNGQEFISLSALNDNGGWTFEQIGKHLINHPENFELDVAKAIKEHFKNYVYPVPRSIQQALKDAELIN